MSAFQLFQPSDDGENPPQDAGPNKRKGKRLPKFLRAEEWEALCGRARFEVEMARTNTKITAACRDEICVILGLYFGLRVSEMCDLLIERMDFERGQILVFGGKGDKDRYIPIPAKTVAALRAHIGARTTGTLLANQNGQLAYQNIEWRMERLGLLAGLKRRLNPHTLRHSYATRLLETGSTIAEVQALLGHANLATTSIYLHCDTARLKGAVDRL